MVTYTRPKVISSFKKNFTITYPIVSGISPILAKKIEASISYKKVMLLDIEDEINNSDWLQEAEYQVGYNRRGVLNIYLSFTGIGAYEQYHGKNVVVDLKTGKRVTAKDVFTKLDGLVSKIKNIQKEEIAESIKEIKEQKDFGDVNTEDLFRYVDFKKIHLEDFSVGENGISFQYDYGFPRIYMMIEPGNNYFLSWKEIKPYIKRGGLLQKFIR
ncbi:MAG: hypothetical protein AAB336_14305 [Acidobacteriota bacterium]